MVFLVCALITIPATWVLMVFWNSLGMQLSYWDTVPVSGATVFLLTALISAMTMDLVPRELDGGEGAAGLEPDLAVATAPGGGEMDPWRGLVARPTLATGPNLDPPCPLGRKLVGRGVGDGFDGPQLRLFGDEVITGSRAGPACQTPPPLIQTPFPSQPTPR